MPNNLIRWGLLQLRHVVAQCLQLDGGTHQIHLVEGGYEASEGCLGSWLKALVDEQGIGAGCTFCHECRCSLVLVLIEQKNVVEDMVVHVVEVDAVAQVGVEIIYLTI